MQFLSVRSLCEILTKVDFTNVLSLNDLPTMKG